MDTHDRLPEGADVDATGSYVYIHVRGYGDSDGVFSADEAREIALAILKAADRVDPWPFVYRDALMQALEGP